jgi:hypothetical protein
MHELKDRINSRNILLGQIKNNMNMIRYKKMNNFDWLLNIFLLFLVNLDFVRNYNKLKLFKK